jgi:hypothetical protein
MRIGTIHAFCIFVCVAMSFVVCAEGLLKVDLMITSANCDTKTLLE